MTWAAAVEASATVQFASASYMVSEGGGSAVIGLSLTGSSSQPVTVTYAVADGTAKANADYQAITPGTLTFAAGETSKSFTVTILQDSESEGNQTVALSLSNPINATLGIPSSAILTIMDDETPPQVPTVQFSSGTYSVGKGGATATITVTLSTAATGSGVRAIRNRGRDRRRRRQGMTTPRLRAR